MEDILLNILQGFYFFLFRYASAVTTNNNFIFGQVTEVVIWIKRLPSKESEVRIPDLPVKDDNWLLLGSLPHPN